MVSEPRSRVWIEMGKDSNSNHKENREEFSMQIEEHRTGFDLTLTLEQLTAEQIGEEACPHSRRPPRQTRVLCSAAKEKTPAEPELARESTAAGFARARKRTDEEPLDGDAPTLRWTRTPARGPAPAPTSRPPPKGRRLLVCEEKKHKKEERNSAVPGSTAARLRARDGQSCRRRLRCLLPRRALLGPSPPLERKERGGERERRERRLGRSRPWRGGRTGRRGGKMSPAAAPDPS